MFNGVTGRNFQVHVNLLHSLDIVFILANSAGPDEIPRFGFEAFILVFAACQSTTPFMVSSIQSVILHKLYSHLLLFYIT